ncbi:hypothetical protein DIPPA_12443 [Diplonema papillatum]|nr:hypothetical protein DIPPA_12443 [Diplonema papillatum]
MNGARGVARGYQCNPTTVGRNVCEESTYKQGSLRGFDEGVLTFLRRNGIARVCLGHKPIGDCPLVAARCGIEVVIADMSHSDSSSADSRGAAVSAVTLTPTRTAVRGYLRDGAYVDFDCKSDRRIGLRTDDGYWVRALLSGGKYYLVKQDGRTYHRRVAAPDEFKVAIDQKAACAGNKIVVVFTTAHFPSARQQTSEA